MMDDFNRLQCLFFSNGPFLAIKTGSHLDPPVCSSSLDAADGNHLCN